MNLGPLGNPEKPKYFHILELWQNLKRGDANGDPDSKNSRVPDEKLLSCSE